MDALRQNVALLDRGIDLVARIEPALYAGPAGGSGVGAHLRHCLDFYRAVLRGLGEAVDQRPRIDYDRRERVVPIERDPAAALAELTATRQALVELSIPADRSVLVRADTIELDGDDSEELWQQSTLGREMMFLISHTIHHFATIATLLRAEGIDPGDDFGVAPATLAFRSRSA